MAKFCSNCGAAMEDSDVVCGECGTPAGGSAAVNSQIKSKGSVLQILGNFLKQNKFVSRIIAAVIIVFIVVNIIGIVVKSSGYEPVLNKMIKAIKNEDVSTLVSISSQVGQSIYGEDEYETMLETFLDTKLDYYEDQIDGKIKTITYEIKDKSELTSRKLEKVKDKISDIYGEDADGISKIVKVDLKLSIKGSKEKTKDRLDNLILLKEDGKWRIYLDYYGYGIFSD
mgnify:CR=1 FL=1